MAPFSRLCGPFRGAHHHRHTQTSTPSSCLPPRPFTRSLGRSPPRSAVPRSLPLGSSDADSAWARVALLRRQLDVAVAEEDYATAARLRDEVAVCEAALTPQKAMLLGLLERLDAAPTLKERVTAAQALGDLGDAAALPALQTALADNELGDVAEASMWSIFMKPRSEAVRKLFDEGMSALRREITYPMAVDAFGKVIAADPSFAEGYNKRATTFYLMKRYREAIHDCETVLDLNPYHFAAASGMGMCWAELEGYPQAIKAFQRAVTINPRMDHLNHHVQQLQALMHDEERGKRERDREG
jgi:tetratricopeptide (TPR) repeat protein